MKLKQIMACMMVALTTLGCAHRRAVSSYRFDYQKQQDVEGVIRAFDDGQHAIVQFVDLAVANPVFLDEQGRVLAHEIRGQYAVLPSIVPFFSVNTRSGTAMFKYTGTIEDDQEKQAHKDPVQPASMREAQQAQAMMQVHFPSAGARFRPTSAIASSLLQSAGQARRVVIVGHADAVGQRAKNDALAQARALAVKSFLVRHGVPARKIVVISRGERMPLASNATAHGRAKNRRADISFEL